MSSKETCTLAEGAIRTIHKKCHAEHGPWQEFGRNLKEKEMHLSATIVLRVGIDECKQQRVSEDKGL